MIAATRRNLVQEINRGSFRSDFYSRIARVKVELPPLCQRLEDIPILVRSMLKDLGELKAYQWVRFEVIH
ncbi:hypothetical protein BCY86_01410 [Pajaroellobacter abortibovis]|uniref:Sigma-54 factor interaction domain-containing protein n=1 Tax=Pajaroellobacter abortibovis TaxID=1882918 RepID=A0A1L6MVE5_9BACT|nr:hypothetical protein BCY86_01410 [Pajaroellobacter abortibovis]